jgi:ABC-type sugar transport system ATPase subunit
VTTIRIDTLKKYYGSVKAVDGIDLEIRNEEFVVLLGPSGCGKTTTLRCIAGLEPPTSGKIYFDDRMVNDLDPADRNIAMVFQFFALYPHLNVVDNISFPLRAQGIPARKIREKIEWVTDLLQLGGILKRRVLALPGGEQQKAALARAIVRDPAVLLLDEPLSQLDETFRDEMRTELGRIQRSLKVTTIYVTHDQREAMALADRIVVMKDGRILQAGAPRDLYEKPQSVFAGYFVGSPGMNFAECVLQGNRVIFKDTEKDLKLPNDLVEVLNQRGSRDLVIGIRPEHISFSSKQKESVPSLRVTITSVEKFSQFEIFSFRMGKNLFMGRVTEHIAEGSEGYVHFRSDRLCFFDAKTERSLFA